MNDLISRSALMELAHNHVGGTVDCNDIARFPAVDAEPVRHEGDTTFITTDNLDAYTGRIIVGQGNMCKVYYADESTVDAVEVVRCAACVHGRVCKFEVEEPEIMICIHKNMFPMRTSPGFYCAHGAKMDTEVQDD